MQIKGLRLEEKTKGQQFKIKLISRIVFCYLHLLDIIASKHLFNFKPEQKPVIYAMWHGYQWGLGIFPAEVRKNIHILISLSNDGETIARICHFLGFSLVRGSQKRQGEKALREMITELKNQKNIVFMVDGPKGPKQKVKKGIIRLAKMAQVPIVPIVPYTSDKISFNSWDNYQVPINLFAKGSIIFGEPIYVPHDATEEVEEEKRLELENYMFELEKDLLVKHKKYWEKKNG